MASIGLALVPLLLLPLASPTSSCTEQQKGSLLQFLDGLSQDNCLSESWRNSINCCKWEGITCDGNGAVIKISLASRGLKGSISPSLGDLTNLLHLNLSYNSFSGGLPSELLASSRVTVVDVSFNNLSKVLQQTELNSSVTDHRPLQVLNISSNLFTGEFPSIVWENKGYLVVLNASNNSFQGGMPSSFCISSSSFAVLDLSYNRFSGSIPPGLGNCSMLKVLKAGHNNLTGLLPDELFNAASLEYLSFPNNGLHGTLDGSCIVNLRHLMNLDLGGNNFSGRIPESIGQLKRLEELHLDHNKMSGELPSALSNCTNLTTINLKSNNFSGELTKVDFSNLINLKVLDLLYNNFSGTIPESIYSCSNLAALRLSSNNFHGQLSPRIRNLKSLIFLSLSSNNFTNITNTFQILKNSRNLTTLLTDNNFMGEVMPQDETIDGFHNLHVLCMSGCLLSGKIPRWLSKLEKLEMLSLHTNQLSGEIPAWIKSLKSLFHLDISNNNLAGEIPTALMEMPTLTTEMNAAHLDGRVFELPVYRSPSLQFRITIAFPRGLNLAYNKFTGVILQEVGQLKSIHKLNFSFNMLSGEIPQQLCKLTNLQVLDLSNNHLTGTIPVALNNLHFLSSFNISNNDLEGPIPNGGQLSTFPNSSFEGNPKLCGVMVNQSCASAEAPPVSTLSTGQTERKVAFAIAFGAFFGVGVLYDQIVLSRYFG